MPNSLRGIALLAVYFAFHASAGAQTVPRAAGASDFPASVEPALQLYRAGDYDRARLIAADIAERATDDRTRREAAVVQALILLRSNGRADMQDGQSRLGELLRQDPALVTRPEVQLAAGAASLGLSETTAALDLLDSALDGFTRAGAWQRVPEAARLLARAWVRHGEWQTTPARFGVVQSDDEATIESGRRAQLAALAERTARLEKAPEAAVGVRLELALYLLPRRATADEGRALLAEITTGNGATPTHLEARYRLAEANEAGQRWREAHDLYSALATTQSPWAVEARRRADVLGKSTLTIATPARSAPGNTITLGVQARGIARIRIEVRRVDLEKFLRDKRGRLVEALLPVDGAVRFTRDVDCRAADRFDAFDSASLSAPLEFTGDAGALVVIAQATTVGGESITQRHLIVVSNLRAAAIVGGIAGIVLATDDVPASAPAESCESLFWVQGVSFVPTTAAMVGGVARFSVPNEARVASERRWVCLVRRGDQMAVCEGRLPSAAELDERPSCLLVAGPPAVRIGETIHVAGMLLPPRAASDPRAKDWRIVALDSEGKTLVEQPAIVETNGAVHAALKAPPQWAAQKSVGLALRCGGKVIENARGGLSVKILKPDDETFELDVAMRLWAPLEGSAAPASQPVGLPVQLRAVYPWGTPVRGAIGHVVLAAAQLPDWDTGRGMNESLPMKLEATLDAHGQALVNCDLSLFTGITPPLGVRATASLVGWDGRGQIADATAIAAPRPAAAWINCEPRTPRRGAPLRAFVGVLDPGQLYSDDPPVVEVLQDERVVTRLVTEPTPRGFGTAPWMPPADASPFVLRTSIAAQTPAAAPLAASRRVILEEPTAAAVSTTATARVQQRDGQDVVAVHLGPGADARTLFATLCDKDPLAAAAIPLGADRRTEIALREPLAPSAEVRIVAIDADGLKILARSAIERTPPTLTIEPLAGATPTATSEVRITARGTAGAPASGALIVRLIDSADVGTLPWLGDLDQRDFSAASPSSDAAAAATDELAAGRGYLMSALRSQPGLIAALLEGDTLWADAAPLADGAATFRVPLPIDARRYRLIAYLASPTGDAHGAAVLDARGATELRIDPPAALFVGDRTVAAVRIRAGSSAARGRLSFAPGGGLSVEQVRVVGGAVIPPGADGEYEVDVPALQEARLAVTVEAQRAGADGFAARFLPANSANEQHVERSYSVVDPSFPAATGSPASGTSAKPSALATISIKRTVSRLSPRSPDVRPIITDDFRANDWELSRLGADERVAPGTYLLIRDELPEMEPLSGVIWMQHVPPTCHTLRRATEGLRTLGQLRSIELNALQYVVTQSHAQAAWHEYVVVAVRPGACRLPPPEVRLGDALREVRVTPEITRIIVEE